MSIKSNKRSVTQTESDLQNMVKIQYNNIMKLINQLLKLTNQTVEDICIAIGIDPSTFYRYQNEHSHINLPVCILAFLYLKQYMATNHISLTPEVEEQISLITIFNFDK